jgi:hypothetical protein
MPSSFASSCTRMFFATLRINLSLSSSVSHVVRTTSERWP